MNDKPELAWNLQDYIAQGQEAPQRIIDQPTACEGELMSDDEMLEYIRDAISTLKVLADSGSPAFERVQRSFFADLLFLVEIGRLSADEYNELVNEDNYRF